MIEVKEKTHLIITDIHDEYHMKWCGKILDAKPELKNGLPVFAVVGTKGRVELNTIDINRLEKVAKLLTKPKGRQAFTSDTARIYIKEIDGNEKLLGVMTHNNIKTFSPMYDVVGYMD